MSDSEELMLLDDKPEQPTARSNSRTEEVSNADLFLTFENVHERQDKWYREIL